MACAKSKARATRNAARSQWRLSGNRPDFGRLSELRTKPGQRQAGRRLTPGRCCPFLIRFPVPTALVPTLREQPFCSHKPIASGCWLQDNYVVHGRLLIAITVVACAGSVRSRAVGSAPSHHRPALWGDLEPGPFDVGFTELELYPGHVRTWNLLGDLYRLHGDPVRAEQR